MEQFTGVFPVHEVKFEIDTSSKISRTASDGSTDFAEVEDMESGTISVETGVETWNSLTQGGWQRALATAKNLSLGFSGKRCIGSKGNDYIASKWLCNGQACNSTAKITFPDGAVLTAPVVIKVSSVNGGDATNVAGLEYELISDGKPTYTAPAV